MDQVSYGSITISDLTDPSTKLKYLWTNLEATETYPAGTYAASGRENEVPPVSFSESDSETYGYNTYYGNGIKLRYNAIDLATLTGDSLIFYQSPITKVRTNDTIAISGKRYYYYDETTGKYVLVENSENHNPVNESWFEDGESFIQGRKGLELDANSLIFYKLLNYDSQEPETVAATLNSNGLNIVEGSITLGNNFSVDNTGHIEARNGLIGGWSISENSLNSLDKTTWDDDIDGIFIGKNEYVLTDDEEFEVGKNYYRKNSNRQFIIVVPQEEDSQSPAKLRLYEKREEDYFTISGGKILYVPSVDTTVNENTEYYIYDEDNDSFIIVEDVEEGDNPRAKHWYNSLGPMWYINSDGSASFGSLVVNQRGNLDVPAASISGMLTAKQINVNNLGAISANIGATVGQGNLTNTLKVDLEQDYVETLDTRAHPDKIYYFKKEVIDEERQSQVEWCAAEPVIGDNPSNMYKITRDDKIEETLTKAATPYKITEDAYEESTFYPQIARYFVRGFNFQATFSRQDIEQITNVQIKATLSSGRVFEGTLNFDFIEVPDAITDENGDDIVVFTNGIQEPLTTAGDYQINILANQQIFQDIVNGCQTDQVTGVQILITATYLTIPHVKQYYRRVNINNTTIFLPVEYFLPENEEDPSSPVLPPKINPQTYKWNEDTDEAGLYEIEYWYEKIDKTYIILDSSKTTYILSDDEEIKEDTIYYSYDLTYAPTLDTLPKENKDYYEVDPSSSEEQYIRIDPSVVLGKNPSEEYWYEQNVDYNIVTEKDFYKKTEDELVDNTKEYYEKIDDQYVKKDSPTGNPKEQEWYEKKTPIGEYWYIEKEINNVSLTLQDANLSIKSNENEVLSVKSSEENDLNVSEIEVTNRIKIGKLELFSFNNGMAVRTIK